MYFRIITTMLPKCVPFLRVRVPLAAQSAFILNKAWINARNLLLLFYPHWHILSSSFTHSLYRWLPHADAQARTLTNTHTHTRTQSGWLWCNQGEATPVVCSQGCQDNDALCWKLLDIPSRVSFSLSHARSSSVSLSLYVCGHICLLKENTCHTDRLSLKEERGSCTDKEWEGWNAGR